MPGSSSRSAKRSGLAVRAVVAGAAQQRANAGEQLFERERLRQVVVGAGVEPFHPVLDLGARGQHQHRQPAPLAPQGAADLEAVHARHEHVQDDRVRLGLLVEPLERLAPVLGQLDGVALELQGPAQRLSYRALVVDDQDLHVRIVRDQREKFLRFPAQSRLLGSS